MSDMTIMVVAILAATVTIVLAVAFSHHRLTASLSAAYHGLQAGFQIASNGGGLGSVLSVRAVASELIPCGPLGWLPIWSQRGGLLPDGSVDPQQNDDCGPTCCAMLVRAIRGVKVEPGYLREQLGGVDRSGLTTADDLVAILAASHISAAARSLTSAAALAVLLVSWGKARAVVVLGNWLSPDSLHWMLLDGRHDGFWQFIDPWNGVETGLSPADFARLFAGSAVVVDEQCHYNVRAEMTPGTGPEAV